MSDGFWIRQHIPQIELWKLGAAGTGSRNYPQLAGASSLKSEIRSPRFQQVSLFDATRRGHANAPVGSIRSDCHTAFRAQLADSPWHHSPGDDAWPGRQRYGPPPGARQAPANESLLVPGTVPMSGRARLRQQSGPAAERLAPAPSTRAAPSRRVLPSMTAPRPPQINAFGDTWEWNAHAARACRDVIEMGAGHF